MERKSICEGKFVFGHNTISLPVFLPNIPKELYFKEEKFLVNDFLHVSLVCIGKIIEKYNILISDFENKIVDDFCEFSKEKEIKLLSYKNDYKFAEKDDKKTIVVLCDISNLEKFFDLINKKYNLNMEYPPTHVTLYKQPDKMGIFLVDLKDIQDFTKPIENPLGISL